MSKLYAITLKGIQLPTWDAAMYFIKSLSFMLHIKTENWNLFS